MPQPPPAICLKKKKLAHIHTPQYVCAAYVRPKVLFPTPFPLSPLSRCLFEYAGRFMFTQMSVFVCMRVFELTLICAHTHARTSHMHALTHTHAPSRAKLSLSPSPYLTHTHHTHTHTHTHAHTHAHTHTCTQGPTSWQC
jgi:ABC-type nickel/cobalt efflux system permease component RcnA